MTGAGGFVGPHLVRHLEECGDEVAAISLDNGPDLLDADAWRRLLAEYAPEAVYHLAGWSDVGASWQHPAEVWRVNTEGTLSVLEAARLAETRRVVVISSADVYGVVAAPDLPITEDHPVCPRSPYGASKVGAETLALQYHRGYSLETVIARPFNHIGPGQAPGFAIPAFAARIAREERAPHGEQASIVHGDLSPRRDFTDVRDVTRAYRLLATDGRPGVVYNVCSGIDVGMGDVLTQLAEQATVPVVPVADRSLFRPVDLPVLRGSHERLSADTGWMPSISLEETLSLVLAEARELAEYAPSAVPPLTERNL